jgi:hypothetical protein
LIFAWASASFAWKPLHVLISHLLHHNPSWILELDKCPRGKIGRKWLPQKFGV